MKQIISKLFFSISIIVSAAHAMEQDSKGFGILTQQGPIKVDLKEGISRSLVGDKSFDAVHNLLKSISLESVKSGQDLQTTQSTQKLGFTFPPYVPWNTLESIYIRSLYESPDNLARHRIMVADLACGKGSFSLQSLCAGANVFAVDQDKQAAEQAMGNVLSPNRGLKRHVDNDLVQLDTHYKVVRGSITEPGPKFNARKNQVIVLNNVIHQLKPDDVDRVLSVVWNNLIEGGVCFICCDTTASLPKEETTYVENVRNGKRYPGYGIVNLTQLHNDDGVLVLTRSFKNIPDGKEDQFPMGQSTLGSFPQHQFAVPGYNIQLEDKNPQLMRNPTDTRFHPLVDPERRIWHVLDAQTASYTTSNSHMPMNIFDYPELKSLVEGFKFTVINAWYTNPATNILSPCVHSPKDNKLVMAITKLAMK